MSFDACGDRVWIDPVMDAADVVSTPSARVGWREADRNLRRLAKAQSALDLELGRWLLIARQTEVHRELGYGSFAEYVERVLGYRPRATEDRLRVAAELETLPAIRAALGAGRVNYSIVRDLTRVVTAETEAAWLAAAEGKTARDVRDLVAGRERGDLPTDRPDPALELRPLHLELEPHVYALFLEARRSVESRMGEKLSDSQLLAILCDSILDDGAAEDRTGTRPPYQIALSLCPDCSRASQSGGGQAIDVADTAVEAARCDCDWLGHVDGDEIEPMTSSIPRPVRRQVVARDHARCTVPGCRVSRALHLHHIEYRSNGGGHTPSNLTCVCAGHHAAIHDGRLIVRGSAPHALTFTHRDGRGYGSPSSSLSRSPSGSPSPSPNVPAATAADAISALRNAGFSGRVAAAAVERARLQLPPTATLEDLVRASLRLCRTG